MAKQTQTKAQTSDTAKGNVVNDAANIQEVQTDAFGESINSDVLTENQDMHNPYSKQNVADIQHIDETPIVEEIKPVTDNLIDSTVIQPTIQEPIKPTLTDEVIYEDFSKDSTVKVENENGVVVNLSGTAAKILKGLDATTKIVK